MIKCYRFVLFGWIFSLIGCATIEPLTPEKSVEEVPTLVQKESSVYIPIKISLQPYLKEADKSIPMVFNGKEEHCEGVSYSYKFDREPITFKGIGNALYYEIAGKYALNLNYCPQCASLFDRDNHCLVPRIYASCGVREPMRRVTVGYATTFNIEPDLTLKSHTSLKKFETVDPCEITVFKFDATDKLKKEVTGVLKDLENDIDKKISAIDIRSEIESAWKLMDQPISLGKYGFLSIQPKALSLSDIRFENKDALVDLNLTIQPTITSSELKRKETKIPRLDEHAKSKGFDIHLAIIASYDSLSTLLTNELAGKELNIKNNSFIFNNVKVDGASEKRLSMQITFSGKRSGTLYLVGTPVFDTNTQVISFPDLAFDLKTKNALLKSAKWLFSDKITDVMRENSRFDFKPQLTDIKKTLQKELNRDITKGVTLNGKISTIRVTHIHPTAKELYIRVNSSGELKLTL
jgi:hypothetical protein